MAEIFRARVDAHPAPQPSGPVEDLLDEGLEILNALIDNIKRCGNYSPDATCTFIDQAGQCLREALSALTAGKPEQAVPSEDEEDGLPCVICGKPIQGQAVMDKNGELGCQGCAGENPGREHLRLIPAAPTAGGGDA